MTNPEGEIGKINLENKTLFSNHLAELIKEARKKNLSPKAVQFIEDAAKQTFEGRNNEAVSFGKALDKIAVEMNNSNDAKRKVFEDTQRGEPNWGEEALRFIESFSE